MTTLLLLLLSLTLPGHAQTGVQSRDRQGAVPETAQERGKRIVDECLAAVGGGRYLNMRDRIEAGRAYSFYREQLSGLSRAKIYTRYLTRPEPPVPGFLGVRERQAFGKDESSAVIFSEGKGFDITFRGARPLPQDLIDRFRETTLRNILYILRQRLGEPGMIFESRGSEVLGNQSVEAVDIFDSENRKVTVYFSQTTKLPVQENYTRRDPKTKDNIDEVTRFSKFRDVGGGVMWPFTIERERNGEKIYQIYSDTITINNDLTDNIFTLPANMKILKPAK